MTAAGSEVAPRRMMDHWPEALLMMAAALTAWWSMSPYLVGVFHDDGIYVLLARSLAEGRGLHYLHLPGLPAATHYPPLYPMVLAAVWRFTPSFPGNVGAMLAVNAVLVGIAAVGWSALARRLTLGPRAAMLGAFVVMVSSPMLTLAGALLSETAFVALLLPSLLACERAVEHDTRRDAIVAGALVGALMLARMHGVALLVGFALVLMLRRRAGSAGMAVIVALLVQLPWILWSGQATPHVAPPLAGSYGSYARWYLDGLRDCGIGLLADTARINLRELWLLLGDRFALGIGAWVHATTSMLAVAALAVGARTSWRRAPVTVLFAILYFAIVVLWPYAPWRFAWGLWPLVALAVIFGVRSAWNCWPSMRPLVGVAASLPALAFARTELHAYATREWRAPARAATAQIAPLVQWTRTGTRPTDVVLSEGEQVVFLYTGRQSAPPVAFTAADYVRPALPSDNARALSVMLHAIPADYLVTVSPDVARGAQSLGDSSLVLRPVPAPNGLAAFEVIP